MLATMLLALPLAGIWMIVTANVSLESLFVGGVLGIAIQLLLRSERKTVELRRLPDQIAAFSVYVVTLARDVLLCSVDVARRVLNPNLSINPGILAVATQDAHENDVIAAFSAHGITLTPGELVMDFDGGHTMFVHCLDVHASAQNAPDQQAKRLRLLRRILGVKHV
jgi:multicomponent Na+:H+ antiporter subunit E